MSLPALIKEPFPGIDTHHTEQPFLPEDRNLAEHLAFFMGTLTDTNLQGVVEHGEWLYGRSSVDEWMSVVRALRVHGLKIVAVDPDGGRP